MSQQCSMLEVAKKLLFVFYKALLYEVDMVLEINKRISKIQSFANMVVRSGLKWFFLLLKPI